MGFSYLGRGVSLQGCSRIAQPLLLTLDQGYRLTATLPELQRGMAPLGPPAPAQPPLLGCGFVPNILQTNLYDISAAWLCYVSAPSFPLYQAAAQLSRILSQ